MFIKVTHKTLSQFYKTHYTDNFSEETLTFLTFDYLPLP